MSKYTEYYHLVTNTRLELGQKIIFSDKSKNKLYDFFFKKEFLNKEGSDYFGIINSGISNTGLVLNNEDTEVVLKYMNITIRGIRELIVEIVRLEKYSKYPSRLNCLYVAKSYEDIIKWKKIFESYGRKILQIVKLETNGNHFEGDGELLPKEDGLCFDTKIKQAEKYWARTSDIELSEVLIDGEIIVTEIVKDYL